MTDRVDRDSCFFCDYDHKKTLEQHHIIPSRLNGPDHDDNKVEVCPACHDKLESLYDDRVWQFVGDPRYRLLETHIRLCPHCGQTLVLDDSECIRCNNRVDLAQIDYKSIVDGDGS